jgi:hypothetical protein
MPQLDRKNVLIQFTGDEWDDVEKCVTRHTIAGQPKLTSWIE